MCGLFSGMELGEAVQDFVCPQERISTLHVISSRPIFLWLEAVTKSKYGNCNPTPFPSLPSLSCSDLRRLIGDPILQGASLKWIGPNLPSAGGSKSMVNINFR